MTWWQLALAAVLVLLAVSWLMSHRRRHSPSDLTRRKFNPDDVRSRLENSAYMGDRLRSRYRKD